MDEVQWGQWHPQGHSEACDLLPQGWRWVVVLHWLPVLMNKRTREKTRFRVVQPVSVNAAGLYGRAGVPKSSP